MDAKSIKLVRFAHNWNDGHLSIIPFSGQIRMIIKYIYYQ
ncbi:hypothetical protein D1AOALGA4SA_2961 [Olavius algarvensis Delta 1 endosymbiont]|nr:hypothetical protein D1AOALGA4SA_2961 [Olavius algarvensis Delta 1 endosymbiont]